MIKTDAKMFPKVRGNLVGKGIGIEYFQKVNQVGCGHEEEDKMNRFLGSIFGGVAPAPVPSDVDYVLGQESLKTENY